MSWDLTIHGHATWYGEKSLQALNAKIKNEPSYFEALESLGFVELVSHRSKKLNFAINQIFHETIDASVDRISSDAWMDKNQMLDWLFNLASLAENAENLNDVIPHSSTGEEFEHFNDMTETFKSWARTIDKFDGDAFLWINAF